MAAWSTTLQQLNQGQTISAIEKSEEAAVQHCRRTGMLGVCVLDSEMNVVRVLYA